MIFSFKNQWAYDNEKTMEADISNREKLIAKIIIRMASLLGRLSLLLFLVFLFIGPFPIVKMRIPEIHLLVWNGILSFIFFIQHSGMMRMSFRNRLNRIVPTHFNGAVYTIFSSIVLTGVVILWQPSTTVLYEFQGYLRWCIRGFFFLALAGFSWGAYSLKYFDPFGGGAIKAYLKGKQTRPQRFMVYGPYLWVRHPLYFFALLLVWVYPGLTLDRLLFNMLWTGWVYIGTVFEEKDLISEFGNQYREYQKKIPMLIPWKGPGKAFNLDRIKEL